MMTIQPTPIHRLSDDFAVASQLGAMDFAILRARGFRTVINNRPDDEAGGAHLQSHEAEALARAHGLDYIHLPVTGLDVTDADAARAFRGALDASDGPVVAHCAAGMRSAILWAFAMTRDLTVDEIVERASAAGFDLGLIRSELEDHAGSEALPAGPIDGQALAASAP